jgi:hypothetical protein
MYITNFAAFQTVTAPNTRLSLFDRNAPAFDSLFGAAPHFHRSIEFRAERLT